MLERADGGDVNRRKPVLIEVLHPIVDGKVLNEVRSLNLYRILDTLVRTEDCYPGRKVEQEKMRKSIEFCICKQLTKLLCMIQLLKPQKAII